MVDVRGVRERDRTPSSCLDHRFVRTLLVVVAQIQVPGETSSFRQQGSPVSRRGVVVEVVVEVVEDVQDVHVVVRVVPRLRVGRSEHVVGNRPALVACGRWCEHRVVWSDPGLVVRSDPHVVDGEDPAQPLCLDLLQSPRCLSGCWRERVERPE